MKLGYSIGSTPAKHTIFKMTTKTTNTLRLLLLLLRYPGRYTRRELSDKIGIGAENENTFRRLLDALGSADIEVVSDGLHRYSIAPEQHFKELGYLDLLSQEDKGLIKLALKHKFGSTQARGLYNKIDALYDYRQLGLDALRRPELEKIEALQAAIRQDRRVILESYKSRSSGTETDRKVEPFGVVPEKRMVKAYDLKRHKPAHFRLDRCRRVRVLDDEARQYQDHYQNHHADVFDIVDKNKVLVTLRLDVSAYVDLTERHPEAKLYAPPAAAPDTFLFEAKVNHGFLGLEQFILANWRGVEIIDPPELKTFIRERLRAMGEKFFGADL